MDLLTRMASCSLPPKLPSEFEQMCMWMAMSFTTGFSNAVMETRMKSFVQTASGSFRDAVFFFTFLF